jgi:hypothetical protein
MTAWTTDELGRIGAAEELEITARRSDGSLREPVRIWVVRVGDDLYIRSWRGDEGGWFRAAHASQAAHVSAGGVDRDVAVLDADDEINDAVDHAYRQKYNRYPSYVPSMVALPARATTLKLLPQWPEDDA